MTKEQESPEEKLKKFVESSRDEFKIAAALYKTMLESIGIKEGDPKSRPLTPENIILARDHMEVRLNLFLDKLDDIKNEKMDDKLFLEIKESLLENAEMAKNNLISALESNYNITTEASKKAATWMKNLKFKFNKDRKTKSVFIDYKDDAEKLLSEHKKQSSLLHRAFSILSSRHKSSDDNEHQSNTGVAKKRRSFFELF